jgi:hypothetical protein
MQSLRAAEPIFVIHALYSYNIKEMISGIV